MALTKDGYKKRLVDDKIERYLKIFGALSIEGPKWCGKTWTALNHSNSVVYLDESAENYNIRSLAEMNVSLILGNEYPQLIDEWGKFPEIWDAVRHKCDMDNIKGKYILTESTSIRDYSKISHSGAGRIDRLKMYSMSLYESGDSTGEISLLDMFKNKNISLNSKIKPTLPLLAKLVVRGGWPENLTIDEKDINILPTSYINAILKADISNDGVVRDENKMRMLIKSLARNESTIVSNSTLIKDIEDITSNEEYNISRNTIADYLNILEKLYLIENQQPYTFNLRSRERVGKSAKRHFTDPSLACAALAIKPDMLINDIKTFGFMFESLVERDLRIYIESLDGKIYHYRNNDNGLEIDAIVELPSGEYGAIEIKLGTNELDDAKKNLIRFSNEVMVEPKFKCIICGLWNSIIKDPETGIYIIPITALKP